MLLLALPGAPPTGLLAATAACWAAWAAMAASAGSAAMTGGAAGPAPAKFDLMEARRVSCRDAPFSFPNGDLLRETQIRTDFVSKYDEGDK